LLGLFIISPASASEKLDHILKDKWEEFANIDKDCEEITVFKSKTI
jgi:hypothetical protein